MYLLYPFTSILRLFGVTQNGSSHSFLFFNLYSTFFWFKTACGLICIDICFYLCFFFFVAAITIRRWKYKRVPVAIVSMYCSTLQIYCPLFTSISVFLLCLLFVLAWLYSWSCSVVWTNSVNSLKGWSGWVGAYTHQIPLNLSLFPGFQGFTSASLYPSSLSL